MSRYPNPWFAIPVLVAATAGAFIGRNFARISCVPADADAPITGCLGREIAFGITTGLLAFFGTAVVTVLVIRSLSEWREFQRGERDRPTVGCETDPEPMEGEG